MLVGIHAWCKFAGCLLAIYLPLCCIIWLRFLFDKSQPPVNLTESELVVEKLSFMTHFAVLVLVGVSAKLWWSTVAPFSKPNLEGLRLYEEVVERCPTWQMDSQIVEQIMCNGSQSFYFATKILPAWMFTPTLALYAFCRKADDLVDDAQPDDVDPICNLRDQLQRCYQSSEIGGTPTLRVFFATVRGFGIPQGFLDALIEGFQWDRDEKKYETWSDTLDYCARAASSVGCLMTVLMGKRDRMTLARACDLGLAMQITNVCRDVGEDATMGRLYLPRQWFREEGIEPDEFLSRPNMSPGVGRVIKRALDEADKLYARADLGIAMLPRDCQLAIYAARLIYSEIGAVVRRNNYDSVSRHAKTGKLKKLSLLLKAVWHIAFTDEKSRSRSCQVGHTLPAQSEITFLLDASEKFFEKECPMHKIV